jgi:hypothetical protein
MLSPDVNEVMIRAGRCRSIVDSKLMPYLPLYRSTVYGAQPIWLRDSFRPSPTTQYILKTSDTRHLPPQRGVSFLRPVQNI